MIRNLGQTYGRLLVWWVDLARRAAIPVVATALGTTTLLFYYTANNLAINTDRAALLAEDLPFRETYRDYKAAFPQFSDLLLVVVEGDNPDLAEDAARALYDRIAEEPERYRYLDYPAGDGFFAENGLLYLDLDELTDLGERLADAQPLLATLTEDPSLRGLFEVLGLALEEVSDGAADPADLEQVLGAIAETVEAQVAGRPHSMSWRELMLGRPAEPDERRQFLLIQPKLDFSALQPAGALIEHVRASAAALGYDGHGGVRVRLTGSAAINHEELESVKAGAGLAGLISLGLVSFLLVAGLGSLRLVLATLVTLLAGLVWTAAFATAAIGHLNLISVAFAVLFIGLAVDFGIHFALRYREERDRGLDHAAALGATAAGVGGALSMCALAAGAGFYAFVPTDYVGLSELGMISGTGIFIALFANLSLLPALLTCLPVAPRAGRSAGLGMAGAERFVRHHARAVVVLACVLGLGALALVPAARFDFNPMNLKDPGSESVRTYRDLIRESGETPYTIEVLAPSRDAAAALAGKLEGLALVDKTVTLDDFVPLEQDRKIGLIDRMALFLTPIIYAPPPLPAPDGAARRTALAEFRDRIARLLETAAAGTARDETARLAAALDRLGGGAPTDDALTALELRLVSTLNGRLDRLIAAMEARTFTFADLPPALRRRHVAPDGRFRIEVFPVEDLYDNRALGRFVAAVRTIAPDATDSPVMLLESGAAVVAAMRQASVTALGIIAIMLLVILRRPRDVGLVLAPLLLAAALTVATSVAAGLPFNFANVIVLPLLLGLGVASGIHLVMRARAEAAGALLLATSTPRAVVFSALTTIGSFGSLVVSSHRGTASMGELLVIAIGFTLLTSLVVLPALMAFTSARAARP